MISKNCEYCGNDFIAERSSAKFCSDSCKTLNNRQKRKNEAINLENRLKMEEYNRMVKEYEEKKDERDRELLELTLEQNRKQDEEKRKHVEDHQKYEETIRSLEELRKKREKQRQSRKTDVYLNFLGAAALIAGGVLNHYLGKGIGARNANSKNNVSLESLNEKNQQHNNSNLHEKDNSLS